MNVGLYRARDRDTRFSVGAVTLHHRFSTSNWTDVCHRQRLDARSWKINNRDNWDTSRGLWAYFHSAWNGVCACVCFQIGTGIALSFSLSGKSIFPSSFHHNFHTKDGVAHSSIFRIEKFWLPDEDEIKNILVVLQSKFRRNAFMTISKIHHCYKNRVFFDLKKSHHDQFDGYFWKRC